MKKLYVLLTISVLFAFGCAHRDVAATKAGANLAVNKVESIKAGKEEGTIDKEFFKKILLFLLLIFLLGVLFPARFHYLVFFLDFLSLVRKAWLLKP